MGRTVPELVRRSANNPPFFAILVSDAIFCGVVLIRKLNAQGKGDTAKIILPALGGSTIVVGIILFIAL